MAATKLDSIVAHCFRYSMVFGLSSYYYNFEKKKLEQTPKAVAYCLVVDLALGIALPIILISDLGFSNVEMFIKRPLAGEVNNLLTFVNGVAVFVSLVSQWVNEKRTGAVFNSVNDIRVNDLAYQPQSKRILRQAERLIQMKFFCSVIMVLGTFWTLYFQIDNHKPIYILTAIYMTLVENVLITVANQFYLGMVYSGFLFKTLNRRVSAIVDDVSSLCDQQLQDALQRKSRQLCREFARIGQMHTNLHKLTLAMKDLYQIQIVILTLTVFVTQVSMFFYFIIILSGESLADQGNNVLMTSGGVVMSVVDLWLLAYVCGEVVLACEMPGEILKRLSSHSLKDKSLQKSIELLSFQMVREKMHLTICGMFDLDWTTGYVIFQASIMKLIFLVQLDYKNF